MEWKEQLPNAVSVSRGFCAVMVRECACRGKWRAALGWFLIGAATDNADGKLARRLDAVSRLGTDLLEPASDTALVKLAEIGLISQDEFSWKGFWRINAVGAALLVPGLLLPKEHRLARRCDTAIGFVYVGEMAYCTYEYARLADAQALLRWGPLTLPIIALLCRRTIARWISQLH